MHSCARFAHRVFNTIRFLSSDPSPRPQAAFAKDRNQRQVYADSFYFVPQLPRRRILARRANCDEDAMSRHVRQFEVRNFGTMDQSGGECSQGHYNASGAQRGHRVDALSRNSVRLFGYRHKGY